MKLPKELHLYLKNLLKKTYDGINAVAISALQHNHNVKYIKLKEEASNIIHILEIMNEDENNE